MDVVCGMRPFHINSFAPLTFHKRIYQNSLEDVTLILNHLLRDDLKAEGYQNGMPVTTVKAQLCAMRRGSSGYQTWRSVHIERDISEVRRSFRELRDVIEDTALRLKISLQLRSGDPVNTWRHGYCLGKRDKKIEQIRSVLPELVSSEDDTDTDMQSPGKRRRRSLSTKATPTTPKKQIRSQLPTPTSTRSGYKSPASSYKKSSKPADRVKPDLLKAGESASQGKNFPRLVYRWYSHQSQGVNTPAELRAGRFIDPSQIIGPPDWNYDAVLNHLVPRKQHSPYISFRERLRPCIFHALKADADANACVAVVDLHKLRERSRQEWGTDDAIKACPQLIDYFGLTLGGRGTYNGKGEWVVWGKVEKEAIVTTFTISKFVKSANQIPQIAKPLQLNTIRGAPNASLLTWNLKKSPGEMSWHTGAAVQLLMRYLRISHVYWKDFGAKFAESWQLRGWNDKDPSEGYKGYMKSLALREDSQDSTPTTGHAKMLQLGCEEDGSERNSDCSFTCECPSQERRIILQDQDLIDLQLHAELASSLQDKTLYEASPAFGHRAEISARPSREPANIQSLYESRQSAWRSRYARPRSSSLFTFGRSRVPEESAEWDLSPSATAKSALHTFTAELMAEAEDCSSVGSFGRGPSTYRDVSEAQVSDPQVSEAQVSEAHVVRKREKEQGHHEGKAGSTEDALHEDRVVVDLCSDDSDEDNIDEVRR